MKGITMTQRLRPGRYLALVGLGAVAIALGTSGCSSDKVSGSSGGVAGSAAARASAVSSAVVAASKTATAAGGAVAGGTDASTVCSKLPVADAQALIRTTLSPAVVDGRLGGCTFVLQGNNVNDNNLTVAFSEGADATKRYDEDLNGTFSAGGATISVGAGTTTPLAGVGDKAVWGSTVGYPEVSALKGSVYCNVSTADDATQLTIIGATNNPLPVGTLAQQQQYAVLEGKLCIDLFSLVH
jgi:hypothetical protein